MQAIQRLERSLLFNPDRSGLWSGAGQPGDMYTNLKKLRQQMERDHALCLEMMTGMSFWVRRLISLMEDLVLRDAMGRTARFLLESETDADGMVRLPSLKRHVASHLNLTSETLSRTLSRLIEAGLVVEHDKNRVELCDPLQLRAVSEGKFPAM